MSRRYVGVETLQIFGAAYVGMLHSKQMARFSSGGCHELGVGGMVVFHPQESPNTSNINTTIYTFKSSRFGNAEKIFYFYTGICPYECFFESIRSHHTWYSVSWMRVIHTLMPTPALLDCLCYYTLYCCCCAAVACLVRGEGIESSAQSVSLV